MLHYVWCIFNMEVPGIVTLGLAFLRHNNIVLCMLFQPLSHQGLHFGQDLAGVGTFDIGIFSSLLGIFL